MEVLCKAVLTDQQDETSRVSVTRRLNGFDWEMMQYFFRPMAQLREVFTAMITVTFFKRNGLGVAPFENFW